MVDSTRDKINQYRQQDWFARHREGNWHLFLRWAIYLILLSGGAGLSYIWYFLTHKLTPLMETQVSDYLSRPVNLGKLETISLTGLKFGQTAIPATATENDRLLAGGVELKVNPLELLSKKKLPLEIELIQPQIYLEQDDARNWLILNLNHHKSNWQGISLELETINLKDAAVTLKAKSKGGQLQPDVNLQVNETKISFTPEVINFKLDGHSLLSKGNFAVEGTYQYSQDKLNLAVEGKAISAREIDYLLPLPLELVSGKINSNIRLQLRGFQLQDLDGDASLNQVSLQLPNLSQPLRDTRGKIVFADKNLQLENLTTHVGSIPATVSGSIDSTGQLSLRATTAPIELSQAIASLNVPQPSISLAGKIKSELEITGSTQSPEITGKVATVEPATVQQLELAQGMANFTIRDRHLTLEELNLSPTISGTIEARGEISLDNQKPNFALDIQARGIPGQKLAAIYEQNLPLEIGLISSNYHISGSWQALSSTQIKGSSKIDVADGIATIGDLQKGQQGWRANLHLDNLSLARLPQLDCEQLNCSDSRLSGNFYVSARDGNFNLDSIEAVGQGRVNFAGGVVNLHHWQLNQGNWQTEMDAMGLELAKLPLGGTYLPISPEGKLDSHLSLRGTTDSLNQIEARGRGELSLAQGKIALDKIEVGGGKFNAEIKPQSIVVSSFHPQLRGKTTGRIKISGELDELTPEQVTIAGELTFHQGIGLIKTPLKTSFHWQGEKLLVERATSEGIAAHGVIGVNLPNRQIENLDLKVAATNLDLQGFPLPLPSGKNLIGYSGKLDFQGEIVGDLSQPHFSGNLKLNNFSLGSLAFNPLAGKVVGNQKEGIALNLSDGSASGDRLNLRLDGSYQPVSLDLRAGETGVTGLRRQQTLFLTLEHLPLKQLAQPWLKNLSLSPQEIEGEMAAKLELNLTNFDFRAPEVIVEQPAISPSAPSAIAKIKGDKIIASVEKSGNRVAIKKGRLTQNETQYRFEGEIQANLDDPQGRINLQVSQADVKLLLESLGIFEFSDFTQPLAGRNYATAKDLYSAADNTRQPEAKATEPLPPLISMGDSNDSLLQQIEKVEQAKNLEAEKIIEQNERTIPRLEELDATFAGSLAINASLKQGISAAFNFEGKNWHWGNYQADLVQVTGNYQDGLLNLLPVKIQKDDSTLSLTGSFARDSISGQVELANLDVKEIAKLLEIEENIELDGQINANISLGGSKEIPFAEGNIEVEGATINDTSLESTKANFSYKNSKINFVARANLSEYSEPLIVKGNFPYQLFSNSLKPENKQFALNLNLNDDMFPLLNIISNNQINWLEGRGKINLDILGEYEQSQHQINNIQARGIAEIENSIIAAKILPDNPLTNINGRILFDLDQMNVENLQGEFSGGKFSVVGVLPLSEPLAVDNPLTVELASLALDIQSLYQGYVKGTLNITGAAITPKIGGNLEIFNGEIYLSEKLTRDNEINSSNFLFNIGELKNLNLTLGDDVKITQEPIITLSAQGDLKLNGKLTSLKPEGLIELSQGNINFFTSRLKLEENYRNIAKFTPEKGFDPFLDLQLKGSVTETNRHQFVNTPIASEIKDLSNAPVTTAQTIRVKASVKGLSSKWQDKIKLTSSPQRSESEIIALLGGGFFDNFSQGDSNLGLANLASAAFLGSFQGELGEALGFSEFRFFPTQILNEEERTSTLGLGAEIGFEVGSNFSVSVMKILTNEQSPQYSVRYRINDLTLLRGSTDFASDSRGAIEFQHRF